NRTWLDREDAIIGQQTQHAHELLALVAVVKVSSLSIYSPQKRSERRWPRKNRRPYLNEENVMTSKTWRPVMVTIAVFSFSLGIWGSMSTESEAHAVDVPKFEVEPFWPKPLPARWVTGNVGGVCIDAYDHVFILSRGDLTPKEQK